jgi:ribosome-associated toxin RatA of RatAB toxin-antitoxin module
VPQIHRQALLPYKPQEVFQLVQRVGDYPRFVPHVRDATVQVVRENEAVATLQLDGKALGSHFSTRNRWKAPDWLTMSLVDGPFTRLEGRWLFEPLGDEGCKVSLDLDFEFSNRWVALAFGKVFERLAGDLFDAFVRRAEEVCGGNHQR